MPRLKFPSVSFDQPSLFDELDLTPVDNRPQSFRFISFGSGSSGNCAYLGNNDDGILIDAGVSPDTVIPQLKRRGIDPTAIRAICLTHDHADHVRFVYKFAKKLQKVAVICTPKTLGGIFRRHSITSRLRDFHRPIYIETPFNVGRHFRITAFQTPHDGTDNVGFFIELAGKSFAVATDLGHVTDRVEFYLRQANHIMLESNYDLRMLHNGPYAAYLKARIAAENGHLDNADAAAFIASIWSPQLKHLFLCHLSHDNNTPEVAVQTMTDALTAKGIKVGDASLSLENSMVDLRLVALPRFDVTPLYILT
ncbi:MAG: MBL fold metallo-hydrolase [Muribaculaceae bacterium]|nr:MBL fold metallo-hydrolase [Muribaculaceae bacterium]